MSHHFPKSSLPQWKVTWYTPEGKVSPVPPETYQKGDSAAQRKTTPTTQGDAQQHVASTEPAGHAENFHQCEATAGDKSDTANREDLKLLSDDTNADAETTWDEAAAFLAEVAHAEAAQQADEAAVKPSARAGRSARRNTQKLSLSEEDQFLLCLSYGMSLRKAAAEVGCHHTTMIKRAQRDDAFAQAIEQAKRRARLDPLIAVRQASQKSWRAAAWLLGYLERQESQGQSKTEQQA